MLKTIIYNKLLPNWANLSNSSLELDTYTPDLNIEFIFLLYSPLKFKYAGKIFSFKFST